MNNKSIGAQKFLCLHPPPTNMNTAIITASLPEYKTPHYRGQITLVIKPYHLVAQGIPQHEVSVWKASTLIPKRTAITITIILGIES